MWMLKGWSSCDLGPPTILAEQRHLRRSVEISYCACKDVVINEVIHIDDIVFTIRGKRNVPEAGDVGVPQWTEFTDTVAFMRVIAYNEPVHL